MRLGKISPTSSLLGALHYRPTEGDERRKDHTPFTSVPAILSLSLHLNLVTSNEAVIFISHRRIIDYKGKREVSASDVLENLYIITQIAKVRWNIRFVPTINYFLTSSISSLTSTRYPLAFLASLLPRFLLTKRASLNRHVHSSPVLHRSTSQRKPT